MASRGGGERQVWVRVCFWRCSASMAIISDTSAVKKETPVFPAKIKNTPRHSESHVCVHVCVCVCVWRLSSTRTHKEVAQGTKWKHHGHALATADRTLQATGGNHIVSSQANVISPAQELCVARDNRRRRARELHDVR